MYLYKESSVKWEGVIDYLLKKASEHHTDPGKGETVTGYPVIDIEYKHLYAVLEEVHGVTYG